MYLEIQTKDELQDHKRLSNSVIGRRITLNRHNCISHDAPWGRIAYA